LIPIRSRIVLGLVLLAAAMAAAADTPSLPKPNRYVTDRSGFLPPDRAAALNEKLAAFERSTSDQVLVYVDRRVPDWTTLEELGARSIRDWGVGRKGKSNGVIFFVFPDERKMRIEVGYGLEGAITDARARRITDEIVKPFFREGNWAGGIEAGVDAILSAARGEPFGGTGKTAAEAQRRVSGPSPIFLVAGVAFLGFWALMAFFIVRGIRRSPAAAAAGGGRPRGGLTTGSGEWSAASLAAAESTWASASPSSSTSDSSSSSSSDFSGGGGDGGGGGSSDSW
jgi:uncharacterized protein